MKLFMKLRLRQLRLQPPVTTTICSEARARRMAWSLLHKCVPWHWHVISRTWYAAPTALVGLGLALYRNSFTIRFDHLIWYWYDMKLLYDMIKYQIKSDSEYEMNIDYGSTQTHWQVILLSVLSKSTPASQIKFPGKLRRGLKHSKVALRPEQLPADSDSWYDSDSDSDWLISPWMPLGWGLCFFWHVTDWW